MRLKINPAKIGDISQVLSIAFAGGMTSWTEKDFAAEIERPDAIFLVAVESERDVVIGYITGRLVSAEEGSNSFDAEIHNIGVDPQHRRQGVGSALFSKFSEHCKKKQVANLWLEVRSRNLKARRFYERKGFVTKSIRRNYYREPVDDANLMVAKL